MNEAKAATAHANICCDTVRKVHLHVYTIVFVYNDNYSLHITSSERRTHPSCEGLTSETFCVGQPMKKRGTQRRVDVVSKATENRGMVFKVRPALFMMTPPPSIPTATAGRFTAPEKHSC